MAGDILSSGYKAQTTSALTTELNSLGDNSLSALGPQITNSTNKYIMADFEFVIGSSYTISTTSFWSVYLVPSIDDTNYASWSTGTYQAAAGAYWAGNIQIPNVSASTNSRGALRGVAVPPGNFKPAMLSKAGTTMPSSSNTLTIRFYNDAYT